MTVLLHPTKAAPERYRVWDRETQTQKYFPLNSKGKYQAEEFDQKVAQIKKVRSLCRDLSVNKLFTHDGRIKGMKRKLSQRPGRKHYEYFALYASSRQTEISINSRGFDKSYDLATTWLLDQHKIMSTSEIRMMFKNARHYYWMQIAEESSLQICRI
jgi:hypothetical protein